MISMLRGKVEQIVGAAVTLDVGGVGYEVFCSQHCLSQLSAGADARLVVHTDVKQDSIRLYGFADQLERQVFLLLIQVQGVGCKSAAEIISGLEPKELLRTIGQGDTQRLQTLKGVGKKTAERIVVELKDRVADFANERQQVSSTARSAGQTLPNDPSADSVAALMALGFQRKDAELAVYKALQHSEIDKADSGQVVKQALRFI